MNIKDEAKTVIDNNNKINVLVNDHIKIDDSNNNMPNNHENGKNDEKSASIHDSTSGIKSNSNETSDSTTFAVSSKEISSVQKEEIINKSTIKEIQNIGENESIKNEKKNEGLTMETDLNILEGLTADEGSLTEVPITKTKN